MKQNSNQQAFIALVKAGLWNEEVRLLPYRAIDFKEVLRIAEEQSVIGLLAVGIERVDGFRVPQADVLTIAGRALQIEQQNIAMNQFVAELFAKLQTEKINSVLVKGQGVAQCYERPMWRSCGDVDLLLNEKDYQEAKFFLLPQATSVETEYSTFKHVGMQFDGFEVELHGCLHTRLSKKIDFYLDTLQNEMFREKRYRVWNNGGEAINIPAPEYDVLFVLTHILHHYYVEGIGLRQICDWCRLLWAYRNDIEHELLKYRLFAMGIETEWKAFAALAVDYLGMPEDAMPFYSPEKRWSHKADKIMAFILKTGNFGHNRQQNHNKAQSVLRKLKDFGRHSLVFPVDSIKFFFHFLRDGLELATKK